MRKVSIRIKIMLWYTLLTAVLLAVSLPVLYGAMAGSLRRDQEAYLRSACDQTHTSEEIAQHVGLSVVTVRRYMNYLSEQQVIDSKMDYSTGGRPCIVYRIRS